MKYTFQGLFHHTCDWSALTDHILWLETRGFNGLSLLKDALDADVFVPFSGQIKDTPRGYILDLKGASVLTALTAISDLAMDYTLGNGACRIDIISAQHNKALSSAQAVLMRAGLHVEILAGNTQFLSRADIKSARYRDKFYDAEAAYRKSLADGILIDPVFYAKLTEISGRTLVEASETSRRGAGD